MVFGNILKAFGKGGSKANDEKAAEEVAHAVDDAAQKPVTEEKQKVTSTEPAVAAPEDPVEPEAPEGEAAPVVRWARR